MDLHVLETASSMSAAAAQHAAQAIRDAAARRGQVRIVAATAASQLEFQRELIRQPDVPWSRVEVLQLDEYIGLSQNHPARFQRLLLDNLIRPTRIETFHLIDGADPQATCARMRDVLSDGRLDLAFVGIGENAHLAFNDPPADFATTDPYIVVTLDTACRSQQVGEGWFTRLDDVPERAVTMSVPQILKADEIVVVVPDLRKAGAVKAVLESDISPAVPASILRTHPRVAMFLDAPAASHIDLTARRADVRLVRERA